MKKLTAYPLSTAVCLLLSGAVWITFYPGNLTFDSISIIFEVVSGQYHDAHPLIIPIVLAFVYKLGGNIAVVILAQCTVGTLGVKQLIISIVRFFEVRDESKIDWICCLLLIALFSPFTPLAIYLATFWKDTWLAICLLWLVAFLLKLHVDLPLPNQKYILFNAVCASVLISFALLVRYNALVIYPILALCLEWTLRRAAVKPQYRLLAAIAPMLILLAFNAFQNEILKPHRSHLENAIYALDLASMIVVDPSICDDLNLTSCRQVFDTFPSGFIVGKGAIDHTLNQGRGRNDFFIDLYLRPGLKSEYILAVTEHPFLLIMVKTLNYIDYLRPDPTRYFFQEQITENILGLSYAQSTSQQREIWFFWSREVIANPVLRWFSFVHAVWLVVNLVALLICTLLAIGSRSAQAAYLGLILLIPGFYYLSFFIAFTASEYRFLFPSMLLVQIISLTAAAAWFAKRISAALGSNQESISVPSPTN